MSDWRKIARAPGYEVSSGGEVRSWRPKRNGAAQPTSPRLRKLTADKDGYNKLVLYVSGKKVSARVCALVAEAWHGHRPTGAVARHLDGGRTNDTPANVVWGTPKENSQDALRHGTRVRGSRVNTSRLSAEAVAEVKASPLGPSALARIYGVTPSAICHIRKGRSWAHVSA